jgi:gliding motility-associated-like protein
MNKLMKFLTYIVTFCCFFIHSNVVSQIVIIADTTRGCDQLNVNFSYTSPYINPTVFWDFGNGTTSTDNTSTVTYTPGAYDVKLRLNGNDSLIITDFILVGTKPDAEISRRDTSASNYLLVNLQANLNNESSILFTPLAYNWEIDGDNEGNSRVAWHLFDTTGVYNSQVIVSDTIGCADTATLQLNINRRIVVPNVFSPNNDGQNDDFVIQGNNLYFLNLQVFTRSGLLIYKTKAKTIRWDGKMLSGDEVPAGIYYYVVEAEDSNPPISQKGFFYIYR